MRTRTLQDRRPAKFRDPVSFLPPLRPPVVGYVPRIEQDASKRKQQLEDIDPGLLPELQDAILHHGLEATMRARDNKIPQEIVTGEGEAQEVQHASGFVPPTLATEFRKHT
ncbi:hypothetical protein H0H87_003771 [Tephrocybe sp. NHM501043]|nr:hypothetical protein H0H87_003771 [Tephrocybe sp. NHM501043]